MPGYIFGRGVQLVEGWRSVEINAVERLQNRIEILLEIMKVTEQAILIQRRGFKRDSNSPVMSMGLLIDATNRDGMNRRKHSFNANGEHMETIAALMIQVESSDYCQATTLGMADPIRRMALFSSPSITSCCC